MVKNEKFKKKYTDFMFDHAGLKGFLQHALTTVVSIASALIYAFGFRAFISPEPTGAIIPTAFVSGGASGLAQNIVLIIELILGQTHWSASLSYTLQSILYFIINIPIFIIGLKGVGKRFAIYSFLNVIFVSLFIKFLPTISIPDILQDMLSRAIFAGICTGLSSAIAYKVEVSAGGMDVISYYFAYRKSTSVGKYTVVINSVVVILFTVLSYIASPTSGWGILTITLYTIIYFFTTAAVVDALNTRNKKTELQIITSKSVMPKMLLANFPHSCTVVPAKGGFSNEDRLIIYIVVSSFEVKRVVKVVRSIDKEAFIVAMHSSEVFGKFFIRPVK